MPSYVQGLLYLTCRAKSAIRVGREACFALPMRISPIAVVVTLILCSFGQAQVTDKTIVYDPLPGPPPMAAANSRYTNPLFGTTVVKLTDSQTLGGNSVCSHEYSYWPPMNVDSTRIFLWCDTVNNGWAWVIANFDPATLTASNFRNIRPLLSNCWNAGWSLTDPRKFYCVHPSGIIKSCDSESVACQILADFSADLVGCTIQQSHGSRDFARFSFNLFCNDRQGYGVVEISPSPRWVLRKDPAQYAVDEVQISRDGRYLWVRHDYGLSDCASAPKSCVAAVEVDTGQTRWAEGGYLGAHFDRSYSDWIANVAGTGYGNVTAKRFYAQPDSPVALFTWPNAYASPMHIGFDFLDGEWLVGSNSSTASYAYPFEGEIVMFSSDGMQRVRRLTHHWAAGGGYWGEPRAAMSMDRRFVLWASAWGDASPTAHVGVYLVTTNLTSQGCSATLSSAGSWFPASAGTYTLGIQTLAGCSWNASSTVPWVRLPAGSSGTGSGTLTFNVDANLGGTMRAGEIRVSGQIYQITQAPACVVTFGSISSSVGVDGGDFSLAVYAPSGCGWQATAGSAWLHIIDGFSGFGPGWVRFRVDTNASGTRTGSISVSGQSFTINQDALVCTVTPSFLYSWFPEDGGTFNLSVSAPAPCAWSAVPDSSWIKVVSGSTGTGSSVVRFKVDPNPNATRIGAIDIGDRTIGIAQVGGFVAPLGCVALSTSSSWYPSSGGSFALGVSASSDCVWDVASNASWVRITSATAGSGSGTILYMVAPNLQTLRTAQITVAGNSLSLTQLPPPCLYALSFSSSWFPAVGGTFGLTVTTSSGCAWTAASNVNWLKIAGPSSFSGTGTVNFTIDRATMTRGTTFFVADQPVTVYQAGQ